MFGLMLCSTTLLLLGITLPSQINRKYSKIVVPASFQLIGKDILTTHAVYWSTMLFALGLEPTSCLMAHGWWTVEGQKMSKSLGNVVDPHLLVDNYGVDSVRYFLLRQIPFGVDGNFAHDDFLVRYNSDLANGIGNLYQRSIGLLQNSHGDHTRDWRTY